MEKRNSRINLLKIAGLSICVAAQSVLMYGCGVQGTAETSGAEPSAYVTADAANDGGKSAESNKEASSTTGSSGEDQARPIFTVGNSESKKDYYFEELENDINGFLRFNLISNGKDYVFFEKTYPDEDYRSEYRLAIIDLKKNQYKEVPVKSDLEVLCKNYTDDLEGYEENGDNYFDVAPDETSYHEALAMFSDDNEIAGVYFDRFGVDKEGNIFALVRFGHTYWGNGQLNHESGDYELLKWSADGEVLHPHNVFNADALDQNMADVAVEYGTYGSEYSMGKAVYKGDDQYANIWCIGELNDKQFTGYYYDGYKSESHFGLFTEVE